MFSNIKNEDDYIYSPSYYYEINIEIIINSYYEKYITAKIKLIFFLINSFVLFIIYYKFPTFETLVLLNRDKTKNNTNFNKKIIEIDNKINESYFEDNIDFSHYSTQIQALAIYFPNIYLKEFSSIMIRESKIYKGRNEIVKKYYQEKLKINQYQCTVKNKENNFDKNHLKSYDFHEYRLITKQINLAKSHGLYGFAFYIFFFSNKIFFDNYINTFLINNKVDFKFLFIFKHRNLYFDEKILTIKKFNKNHPQTLILRIKKYLKDERYIKMNSKPIICIDNFKNKTKLTSFIVSWRKEARYIGFEDLFIITSFNTQNISSFINESIYDAGYEYLPKYLLQTKLLINFKKNYTFFSGLIYNDINFKTTDNFTVFRGSTLENEMKIKHHNIFGEYNPELFYIMNKKIINWMINNYNESKFIFINSWNNYYDGAYLEPENKYGYGSLNSLSKALYNLDFKKQEYNISNLINNVLIAVQVHIFWEDLIDEIINRTNNIPVKFDLYITTMDLGKKKIIKEYIQRNSKANNFEIKIVKNKGRDILPLLIQMKSVIYKYKYFCHIHTKKSLQDPRYGLAWRTYLYENLLGNTRIISEILSDFENNENLGFIFPEAFYEAKVAELKLSRLLINSMNYLINKMFKGYKKGKNLDFPAGDMFWAKSKAVYQIFQINLRKDIFDEGKGPQTLLFAIERIWLYIVKYNGYYYKKKCGYY